MLCKRFAKARFTVLTGVEPVPEHRSARVIAWPADMKKLAFVLALLAAVPAAAQQYKIAVIGMVHSHVWGHIGKMINGDPARLVGIAETLPDLIAEAKKRGAPAGVFFDDPAKMLDQTKPDIV